MGWSQPFPSQSEREEEGERRKGLKRRKGEEGDPKRREG